VRLAGVEKGKTYGVSTSLHTPLLKTRRPRRTDGLVVLSPSRFLLVNVAARWRTKFHGGPPCGEIYLRQAEERSYCERLHQLQVLPSLGAVSVKLVCVDRPWVPYRWPEPPRVPELSAKI
jgi:hypothetical protein